MGVEQEKDWSGVDFRPRWGGGKGEEMKHQTPSESPTGVGDHRGFVLGISPPPPEHRGTIGDDSEDEDDENDEDDDDVDDEPPLGGSRQAGKQGKTLFDRAGYLLRAWVTQHGLCLVLAVAVNFTMVTKMIGYRQAIKGGYRRPWP